MGKAILRVKFEFVCPDGDDEPGRYFKIHLGNLLISGGVPSLVGTILNEHVSVKHSKI